jgi:transposase
MDLPRDVAQLNTQELRDLTTSLIAQLSAKNEQLSKKDEQLTAKDEELKFKQLKIDQLTHEMAILKRWRFGRRSEQLDPDQRSLLEESIDEDLEAISLELEALRGKRKPEERPKDKPRRTALPSHLPRREIRHEPEKTVCSCGCQLERIGEDVSEKLDYTPGTFQVERHVRGKWVCRSCETLIQAPVPPQVIDKGIPTAGLLAHVLVSKFADHTPLYRLEGILERAEVRIPRSTLGQWSGACGVELSPLAQAMKAALLSRSVLHADETPVPMLEPGLGHTHKAYLWSYGTTQFDPLPLVVYDFAESRSGHHARAFLGSWSGKLVCDDFSGYKALFERGVIEIGCMAHARRKFEELHQNQRSEIAAEALLYYGLLYDVETEAREQKLDAIGRQRLRAEHAQPVAERLQKWLILHRSKVPDGSATAKAIEYSLGRWEALIRYIKDGDLPIDNNWLENRIRPVALGRANWLFAGSLRAGQRAAVIMSLIQSAKLNGHDPYRYLKDVLERLPTQAAGGIGELLPHRWRPMSQR